MASSVISKLRTSLDCILIEWNLYYCRRLPKTIALRRTVAQEGLALFRPLSCSEITWRFHELILNTPRDYQECS